MNGLRVALFHGYELLGSGSNEYNRYLAWALLNMGHTVHLICREPHPEKIPFVRRVWNWDEQAGYEELVMDTAVNQRTKSDCILHRIPCGPVYPVYLTDKQRGGQVHSFVQLSDAQLQEFTRINVTVLDRLLALVKPDILHCNHLVMQPQVAAGACLRHGIPWIIFPHGSAIEYTVKKDRRYRDLAATAIDACTGLIIGNREVTERLTGLFPERREHILAKTQIVGVGVDTELFTPVSRAGRRKNLDAFLAAKYPAHGKTPAQLAQLHQSLARGEYESLSAFREAYTQDALDTDVNEKLHRLQAGDPLLIFVGALTAGKGLQSLLCAFTQVLQGLPHAQLLIVGSGAYREVLEALVYGLTQGDQALLSYLAGHGFDLDQSDDTGPWSDVRAWLKKTSASRQTCPTLLEKVIFTGRMNHAQLRHVFPCADLAVFPSVIAEAYPLVLMEALANGVLPLVSDFSGFQDGLDELAEMIDEPWVEKLRIPMGEDRIEVMAANIGDLLRYVQANDPGDKLATVAREKYDWRHRAAAMTQAYRRVIAASANDGKL